MHNDIANAYAFGTLLRENPKADSVYENSTPQQKQNIILQVASASPVDLQKIIRSLEDSAR